MKRYIDLDKAINKLCKKCIVFKHNEKALVSLAEVVYILDDTKSENVVEVVRCENCKWFQCNMSRDGVLPRGVPEYECRHWCGECDPTDYCSYGER